MYPLLLEFEDRPLSSCEQEHRLMGGVLIYGWGELEPLDFFESLRYYYFSSIS